MTGLEPATPSVTGWCSNHLSYTSKRGEYYSILRGTCQAKGTHLSTQSSIIKNIESHIASLPENVIPETEYLQGGKLLRSRLFIEVAKIFSGINRNVLASAAILEILHTTTILHDDVLDRSERRRGHATLNKVFSSRGAVFLGDILFSHCLKKIYTLGSPSLSQLFIEKLKEVCEGEIQQDLGSADLNKPISLKDCETIAEMKTGALFALSMAGPMTLKGYDKSIIKNMETIGYKLGLFFQIQDDFKDLVEDSRYKGQASDAFKHWTYANVLWHQLKPEEFQNFAQNSGYLSEESIAGVKQGVYKRSESLFTEIDKLVNNFTWLKRLRLKLLIRAFRKKVYTLNNMPL